MKSPLFKLMLACVSLLLAGCAALRVDVDVYKGPLASTDATQDQQLISMAMAAKPLVTVMRNRLVETAHAELKQDNKHADAFLIASSDTSTITAYRRGDHVGWGEWSTLPAVQNALTLGAASQAYLRQAQQLNGILSFYRNLCVRSERAGSCVSADDPGLGFTRGRPVEGIEALADAISQRSVSADELKQNRQNLQSILVDFAARIQFYTNNQWIVEQAARDNKDLKELNDRLIILLQTVSNTLLVQTDELRRTDDHRAQESARLGADILAAGKAFVPRTSDQLYKEIVARARAVLEAQPRAAGQPVGPGCDGLIDALKTQCSARLERARHSAYLLMVVSSHGQATRTVAALAADPHDAVRTHLSGSLTVASALVPQLQPLLRQHVATLGTPTVAFGTLTAGITAWATATHAAHYADFKADAATGAMLPGYQLLSGAWAAAQRLPPRAGAVSSAGAWTTTLAAAVADQLRADATAARELLSAPGGQSTGATPALVITPTVVLTALETYRGTVTANLLNQSAVDGKRVLAEVLAVVSAAPDDATRTHTLDVLRKVAPPPDGFILPGRLDKPLDVLDAVLTQLRYEHLNALRSGSTDAAQLAQAVSQALKYRANLVYVRSNTAYLRSAMAATFAQDNPVSGWRNMLNDTITNIGANFRDSLVPSKNSLADTRKELDKVFWQNINSVRLNAGGDTNYVVAKDDVGNWYVKGMGADPKAMISAARNLALFNMGSRINSNLLRIDELRHRLDTDTEAGEGLRSQWERDIQDLSTGTASAGAVSDRNETLELFQANYDKATSAHQARLKDALTQDTWLNQIRARWAGADSASLQTLSATLADTAIRSVHDKARDQAGDTATGGTASAIVTALQSLESYRRALHAAILVHGGLVQPQQQAWDTASARLAPAGTATQASFGRLTAAELAVTTATAALGRATGADVAPAQARLDEARVLYGQAATDYKSRAEALQADQTEAGRAYRALADARERRAKFAADVNAVLRTAIEGLVRERLRAVEELETAARVVGRTQ